MGCMIPRRQSQNGLRTGWEISATPDLYYGSEDEDAVPEIEPVTQILWRAPGTVNIPLPARTGWKPVGVHCFRQDSVWQKENHTE